MAKKKVNWEDRRNGKKGRQRLKKVKSSTTASTDRESERNQQAIEGTKQFNRAVKNINKSLKYLKKASVCLMDVRVLETEQCKTIFKIRDDLFKGVDKLQDDFDKRMGVDWT